MNQRIDLCPAPRWNDFSFLPRLKFGETFPDDSSTLHFYTGSGKAALSLVLSYLRKIGALKDKMTEVLVPQWIGVQVYQTFLEHCFPVKSTSNQLGALFVYHQYGFPQKMDKVLEFARSKNLVVIEDCAHAFGSEWEGRPLGSLGDFAIFSYSKYAFCYPLGGVSYKERNFLSFAMEKRKRSSSFISFLIHNFKFFDEMNLSRQTPALADFMTQLRKMAYATYPDAVVPGQSAIRLWEKKKDAEINWRKTNFANFVNETEKFDILGDLPRNGIVPYALPLKVSNEKKALHLLQNLTSMGIAASFRQFDFNRFLLEPKYETRLLIPFHSQVGTTRINQIIELINKAL
jgi:hypothetical protein